MSVPPSRVQRCVGRYSLWHDDYDASPDGSPNRPSDRDGWGGLALNSVNFCIATTGPIGTDRGINQRQLRAGWAVHLPSVTLAVQW
jgi:hypothetical protein